MKCLISFPNVAILTTSYLKQTMKSEFLSHSLSTLTILPPETWYSEILKFLSDPETAPIFPNPPLVSFKRDRNLRNSLVRSSLPSNLEPRTFNCSRKVCNTCPFINSKTNIDHFTIVGTWWVTRARITVNEWAKWGFSTISPFYSWSKSTFVF